MDYTNAFTKGLFSSPGNNLMPPQYSTDMCNMRIDNGVMTVRNGFRNIVMDNSASSVSGLASNNGNLYVAVNGNLKKVDFVNKSYTNIGVLANSNRMYPLTFNKNTIFLNDGQPYVYDGTTLGPVTTFVQGLPGTPTFTGAGLNDIVLGGSSVSSVSHTFDIVVDSVGATDTYKWRMDGGTYTTLVPMTGIGSPHFLPLGINLYFLATTGHTLANSWSFTVDASSSPRFGVVFAGETLIAGGGSGTTSRRNIIYGSVPVGNNPANSYNWTGTGSFQLVRKSDVLAMATTMDRLFIFEDTVIETMTTSGFTQSLNGSSTPTSTPLAQGESVPNNGCVIVAGDKLFFLTKGKRIKSVNYVMGVDQAEIADISNTSHVGITKFLDEQLNDDLSQTVGFYDELNKHCKWFVRSRNSIVNDIVIIWDLVNSTFLIDNNKFYSCLARHSDGNFYSGSSLNTSVYQDEYGQDDDGANIDWYRYSAPLDNEKPRLNKLFSEVSTTGTIDSTTVIKKEIFVDNKSVDTSYISKPSPVLDMGVGSHPLGTTTIGDNPKPESIIRFTKRRDASYLNSVGKFLQIKYSGSGVGQNFTLETIHTQEKVTNYREFEDV